VKRQLLFKAELENIESLEAQKDIDWEIQVKCSNCGEVHDKYVTVNSEESTQITGSRGAANLVIRCKFCKRENSIDIIMDSKLPFTSALSGKFSPLITFDCRGIDFVAWKASTGFQAVGTEGTKFDCDLREGDWTDFDEKSGNSVGIYNIETKVK